MKQIFKFMMIAAATMTMAACDQIVPDNNGTNPDDENNQTPTVELNQNLEFTLEVESVEADKAKIQIENNGSTSDTWFGFVTSEVSKTDAELIQAQVTELTAGGKVSGLQKSTSKSVTVRDLEPESDYKYIVFGLSENGEVYGKSSSVTFKTLKGELQYTENAAWTVAYAGAGTINGTNYDHTVSVKSTDENYYFVTVTTVEDFTTAGIKTVAEANLADLKAFLDGFNAENGTSYKVVDMLFKGDGVEAFNLEAGEWYAIAIGVDQNGELTGLYAKSEVISIQEEEPTEEYLAWIGDWTFTGSNGAAYNVTFEKKVSNRSYNMYGYDGNDLDFIPVEVTWMADYGLWTIYPQNFGDFEFDDGSIGTIYFLGGMQAEEGFSLYTDVPACLGGILEDGSKAIYGYAIEEEGIEMTLMCHFVVMGGTPYFWNDPTAIPTFPIVVTEGAATASKSMSAVKTSKRINRFTNMPKFLKASDFEKAYMIR